MTDDLRKLSGLTISEILDKSARFPLPISTVFIRIVEVAVDYVLKSPAPDTEAVNEMLTSLVDLIYEMAAVLPHGEWWTKKFINDMDHMGSIAHAIQRLSFLTNSPDSSD